MMRKDLAIRQKSWLMCAGLMPLPDAVINDIKKGEQKSETRGINKKKCTLTPEQREIVINHITQLVKQGSRTPEIYISLMANNLISDEQNCTDASYGTVVRLVKDVIKTKQKREVKAKKILQSLNEGLSDTEIAEIYGVSESYVRTVKTRDKQNQYKFKS